MTRAARTGLLGAAVVDFDPLPFDGEAATRCGTLVALTLESKRDPRPRRLDLMIAAVASARGLPLFTRNNRRFRRPGRHGDGHRRLAASNPVIDGARAVRRCGEGDKSSWSSRRRVAVPGLSVRFVTMTR